MHLPTRSDEPIYWLLFGLGGMTVAIVLPAIIIVMIAAGLSGPDLSSGLLNFAQAKSILGNFITALILFGVLFSVFFHAFHRLYHSLHDLGIHVTKLHWFVFYGGAAACSFITLGLMLLAYFKLF